MAANFDRFLGRMTGPARLRCALRENTRPLFSLLDAVNNARSVKTTLPAAVLGGDIFGLMSNRLKSLLEVPTPPEKTINASRATRPISLEDFVHRESLKALLTTRDNPAPGSIGAAKSQEVQLNNRRELTPAPASSPRRAERDSLLASPVETGPESVFPLLSNAVGGSAQLVSASSDSPVRRTRHGHASLLETKLRKYWELTQDRQSYESNPVESNPVGGPSPSSIARVPTRTSITPYSRPWPEFVGQEISAKARAVSGEFPGDASSGMSRRSSQKVEIQNVFNIEVRNEANSGHGFDDLSEKITEILNEQAIQHGIDVT